MSTKSFKLKWAFEDSRAARKQGWDLFVASGRFEIEVFTERPARFAEGDDDDAVAWLILRASRGDALAAKGLLIAGLMDPQWFAADLTTQVKKGTITVMDINNEPFKPFSAVEHRCTTS
jgi:hypothetical protein